MSAVPPSRSAERRRASTARGGRRLGLASRVALVWVVLGVLLGVPGAPSETVETAVPRQERAIPVVFVPGLTGTRLEDPRDGHVVWGTGAQLVRPRDGGYELVLPLAHEPGFEGATPADAAEGDEALQPRSPHAQAAYEPVAPLWELRVPGWRKPIYQPLVERFESAGYPLGRLEAPAEGGALFFFNYDWRRGNLESIAKLARQLTELVAARGGAGEVDLICQSNAARICRYLAKYGALPLAQAESGQAPERGFSVRKLVLVGASNDGAVRSLQLLLEGRSYIPLVGRRFLPEIFFSVRTLFEDLPGGSEPVFFDSRGRPLEVDLYAPENWARYGWSIFSPEARERVARAARPDLFGDESLWLGYLEHRLDTGRRLHDLLGEDSAHFSGVRYYRMENRSTETMKAALLTFSDGSWRTLFSGDRPVSGSELLRPLASAPGDGHATLASQRDLSPQEEASVAGSYLADGGHFEMVIAPESLDALLAFLGD